MNRWRLWAAVVGGSFAALEADAILSRGGRPTLSQALRLWLGIRPHKRWGSAGAVAFAAGCAWLAVHIALDTWSWSPGREHASPISRNR